MTRINVFPPAVLTDEHLVELRELPRVFTLAARSAPGRPVPARYTMGEGHMLFFLSRLGWLGRRHAELTAECLSRGYKLTRYPPLPINGGDWEPDDEARRANAERLVERLRGAKRAQHYRGVVVPSTFYDHLLR